MFAWPSSTADYIDCQTARQSEGVAAGDLLIKRVRLYHGSAGRQPGLVSEYVIRNQHVFHATLVDSDGTVLFETPPPHQPVPVITEPPLDLWLRFPSGKYFLLDRHSNFFRNYSSDGEIYYAQRTDFPAPPHQGLKVYDVEKRISQEVDYRTVKDRKYDYVDLSANGNGKLVVRRKVTFTRPRSGVKRC